MENKLKSHQKVNRHKKKLKTERKLYDDSNEIVLEDKQEIAPRPTLPISIPFSIFKPKQKTDKSTQTDITFLDRIEQIKPETLTKDTQTENSKQVGDTNEGMNPNSAPLTPILSTIYEAITPDCVPPSLNQNDNTIEKEPTKLTNADKTPNVIIMSNEKVQPSKTMNDEIQNPAKTNNDIPKCIDQNESLKQNEMLRPVIDYNTMNDIFRTSQNYKIFANKIFFTVRKLFQSRTIGNNIEKLTKISDMFENIVNLFLSEFDANIIEKRDQETNTEPTQQNPKENVDQVPTKSKAEIDLQLQTMKREIKDDEDMEECTEELPDVTTRAEKAPTPETQIEIPRTEAVVQRKKPPTPMESENYNYEHYHNLYMAQNQPTANVGNGSNMAQFTRPPVPPAPVQNIPPTQHYPNQNYYTNQEATNKSHRYPSKRPYNNTPYRRYPHQGNQVINQQPSHIQKSTHNQKPTHNQQSIYNQQPIHNQPPTHNQQSFYPQYLHQQNMQMQGHMFSQNTPY